jgi:hypothetical protein
VVSSGYFELERAPTSNSYIEMGEHYVSQHGAFHDVREQFLDCYIDEFKFRYNNRHVVASKVERLEYHMDMEE